MLIFKLCQWPEPQIWTAGYRMEPEHEGGQLFCEWVPRCSEFSMLVMLQDMVSSGHPGIVISVSVAFPALYLPSKMASRVSTTIPFRILGICPVGFDFFVWVNAPKVPWFWHQSKWLYPGCSPFSPTHLLSSNRWKFPYLDMIFLRNPMKHDMNFLITEDVPEKKEISIPHQ